MDNLATYTKRIVNKIIANKLAIVSGKYKKVKVDYVTLNMNYRKKKKEVYQVYELLTILEQVSGEKVFMKLNETTAKNRNLINFADGKFEVKLRKKKANFFLNNFIYIALGERNNFTIKERNIIDLKNNLLSFRYKNLKIFRNYLFRNFINLEAKIRIDVKYKVCGYPKTDEKSTKEERKNMQILNSYRFFLGKKNEYRIK